MSNIGLIINLAITIFIILFMIFKWKQNPIISMFVAALFMGIASKVGAVETINAISEGFGNTLTGIGISVGFGVILGQVVADTGAVQAIANKTIELFGEEKSDYALGVTGFIVSIPVFYDVAYVILVPLAKTLSEQTKENVAKFLGSLVAGLGIAHTFIPPTPGPLTGAELLGIDVGRVILFGILIGLPTFILTMIVYNKFFLSREGFWTDDCYDEELQDQGKVEELDDTYRETPGILKSVSPILVPIVMIIVGTVYGSMVGSDNVPEIVKFISNKNIAMFAGVLASFLLAKDILTIDEISRSVDKSLSSAGVVLLITGMGGGLGNVLGLAGAGDALLAAIQTVNIHPILFIWLVSALMKLAQGSGTVAMITSVGLIAPIIASIDVEPVLIAMAAFSGTLMFAHVNDSAFWITAKIGGLSTEGGLKIYSLVCGILAIISLLLIFALNLFI